MGALDFRIIIAVVVMDACAHEVTNICFSLLQQVIIRK